MIYGYVRPQAFHLNPQPTADALGLGATTPQVGPGEGRVGVTPGALLGGLVLWPATAFGVRRARHGRRFGGIIDQWAAGDVPTALARPRSAAKEACRIVTTIAA